MIAYTARSQSDILNIALTRVDEGLGYQLHVFKESEWCYPILRFVRVLFVGSTGGLVEKMSEEDQVKIEARERLYPGICRGVQYRAAQSPASSSRLAWSDTGDTFHDRLLHATQPPKSAILPAIHAPGQSKRYVRTLLSHL